MPSYEETRELISLSRGQAYQFARFFPPHVSRDDFVSAAMLGLAKALKSYDPSRGVPLSVYVYHRVSSALRDEVRNLDWLSRGDRREYTEILSAWDAFVAEHQRQPTSQELADVLGITVQKVEFAHGGVALAPVSLEWLTEDTDALAVGCMTPEETLIRRELIGYLHHAIAALSPKRRFAIVGHYFEDRTHKEVAAEMGVSESAAAQLCLEALRELRLGITAQFEVLPLPPGKMRWRFLQITTGAAGKSGREGLLERLRYTNVLGLPVDHKTSTT